MVSHEKTLSPSNTDPNHEFFLTSYMLGAPSGRNLGAAGYSHEFVARLFRPLLERFGAVREIRDPRRDLQAAVDDCIRRGQQIGRAHV